MEFTLGPNGSMCFVGSFSFTFGDPGPQYIDLEHLAPKELNQLVYNVRRGILVTDESDALMAVAENSAAASKEFATQAERPVTEVAVETFTSEEAIEEDLKELRAILTKPVATVKREASGLRGGRIRKLLVLEQQGKARVSLVRFLEQLVTKQSDSVQGVVGSGDLSALLPEIGNLSQVSSVVDYEETSVTLDRDGLNPQDILNPLPE